MKTIAKNRGFHAQFLSIDKLFHSVRTKKPCRGTMRIPDTGAVPASFVIAIPILGDRSPEYLDGILGAAAKRV